MSAGALTGVSEPSRNLGPCSTELVTYLTYLNVASTSTEIWRRPNNIYEILHESHSIDVTSNNLLKKPEEMVPHKPEWLYPPEYRNFVKA
jgi:hypothetical protein